MRGVTYAPACGLDSKQKGDVDKASWELVRRHTAGYDVSNVSEVYDECQQELLHPGMQFPMIVAHVDGVLNDQHPPCSYQQMLRGGRLFAWAPGICPRTCCSPSSTGIQIHGS